MNRILATTLIGSGVAVALAVGGCMPAFADTTYTPAPTGSRSLAAIQATAKLKTSARITALNTAIAKVTSATDITSSDRATILGTLNNDLAGMNTVEAKIAADTTAQTAATDLQTVFTTYRVYAVAIPQASYASGADRMTGTTIPNLTAAQKGLVVALKTVDASKSTAALQADLTDMQAQISAASGLLNGVAANALAVTPTAFNANHTVLQPERTAVTTALADLTKAGADGNTVLAAIQ